MAQVRRLKGKADFYFQHGKQIVRSWPKKSNLVPTPRQKIQRNLFRLVEQTMSQLGPYQRKAFQSWQPGRGQTWRDFLHRVWLGPAQRNTLFAVPDFTYAVTWRNLMRNLYVIVRWDASAHPNARPWRIVATNAAGGVRPWPWTVLDYKIQRGQFRQPRWTPSIPEPFYSSPLVFNPTTGEARFIVPRFWKDAYFACLPANDPDNAALLTACIFAPYSNDLSP